MRPSRLRHYHDRPWHPAKRAKALRLIRSLKQGGARIDAIGIQGHWLIDWPPVEVIAHGIATLAAEGLKIMVTECDIDPLPRDVSGANMARVERHRERTAM